MIDTKHNRFLFSIPGIAGPNGVVAIYGSGGDDDGLDSSNTGQLWVGDADSTAKVVDLVHPFAAPISVLGEASYRSGQFSKTADELSVLAGRTRHVGRTRNGRGTFQHLSPL